MSTVYPNCLPVVYRMSTAALVAMPNPAQWLAQIAQQVRQLESEQERQPIAEIG